MVLTKAQPAIGAATRTVCAAHFRPFERNGENDEVVNGQGRTWT
jgi:hypothetical protein